MEDEPKTHPIPTSRLQRADSGSVPQDTNARKHRGAIRACQSCRSRRIKCDSKKPRCTACERSGALCAQDQFEPRNIQDTGPVILKRIDDIENLVRSLTRPEPDTVPFMARSVYSRGQDRTLNVTTEHLLSWNVFQDLYDGRRNLKAILQEPLSHQPTAPPSSFDVSLLMSNHAETQSPALLLDRFFNFVHVKNPMLDEGNVRQMVHRLFLDGPGWNAECCLALVVCAIALVATSFDSSRVAKSDEKVITTAQAYFNAAQRRIGTTMYSIDLLGAQCHFYSGVYLMTQMKPLRAWRHFNQCLAYCQSLTCANHTHQLLSTCSGSAIPSAKLPAEESVYWSCWKSERELRIYLDLPDFPFNNRTYPLLFPTPPKLIPDDQAIAWYFYLAEISLLRLEERVRNELTNLLGSSGRSLVDGLIKCTQICEELAIEWVQSLPPIMNLSTSQEEDDILKFILRGRFIDLWEIIYWPWIEGSINGWLRKDQAREYTAKGFDVGIRRIQTNKPGFNHRHHGTWLMIQSCTRSALVLLAAAYSAELVDLVPVGWREAVSDVVELLYFWKEDAPDAADRLQILEELVAGIPQ